MIYRKNFNDNFEALNIHLNLFSIFLAVVVVT